jgi:hypothetical protein
MATQNKKPQIDYKIEAIHDELFLFQSGIKSGIKSKIKPTDEEKIKNRIKAIIKEKCPEELNCEIETPTKKSNCINAFKNESMAAESGCRNKDELKEIFINKIFEDIKNKKIIKNDQQQKINFVKKFKFCFPQKVPNSATNVNTNSATNVEIIPTAIVDPNTTGSEVINPYIHVDTNASEEDTNASEEVVYEDDFEEEEKEEKGGRKRRTRKQKKRRTRKQRRNKKSSRKRQ